MKRKKRDINPIVLLPVYHFAYKVLPVEYEDRAFIIGYFRIDNMENRVRKDLEGIRERFRDPKKELLHVRIRELKIEYKCVKCDHVWIEVHDREYKEYTCPECQHFNTALYDEKVHIRVIEDEYKNWTTAQWLAYDQKWKEIEASEGKEVPKESPEPEKVVESVASQHKVNLPPQFEQLSLF